METCAAGHPSDEALQALSQGRLDDAAAQGVISHLDICPLCRDRVSALPPDPFLDRLRQVHSHDATPAPAQAMSETAQSINPAQPASTVSHVVAGLPPELTTHPQYEILRELGHGGMGVVYLARHRLSGRQEVLKVMNRELLTNPGSKARFLREIQSAAALDHPNVVKEQKQRLYAEQGAT
jgi:serine/threonine protein kinase